MRLSQKRIDRVLVVAEKPDLRDLAVAEVLDDHVVRVQLLVAALVVRPLEADSVLVVREVRVWVERELGSALQEAPEHLQELIVALVFPCQGALPRIVDDDVVDEESGESLYVASDLCLIQVA
jgi:hypothetical protein